MRFSFIPRVLRVLTISFSFSVVMTLVLGEDTNYKAPSCAIFSVLLLCLSHVSQN